MSIKNSSFCARTGSNHTSRGAGTMAARTTSDLGKVMGSSVQGGSESTVGPAWIGSRTIIQATSLAQGAPAGQTGSPRKFARPEDSQVVRQKRVEGLRRWQPPGCRPGRRRTGTASDRRPREARLLPPAPGPRPCGRPAPKRRGRPRRWPRGHGPTRRAHRAAGQAGFRLLARPAGKPLATACPCEREAASWRAVSPLSCVADRESDDSLPGACSFGEQEDWAPAKGRVGPWWAGACPALLVADKWNGCPLAPAVHKAQADAQPTSREGAAEAPPSVSPRPAPPSRRSAVCTPT